MIKAIDTPYNSHLFRSRLEARWAKYFDELAVNWQYEKEGFELGNGIRYLPDFYLPDHRIFAEIKPTTFTYKERLKCKKLALLTQCYVIELIGLPHADPTTVFVPSKYYSCSKCGKNEEYDNDGKRIYCNCKAKHNIISKITEMDAILLLHSPKQSYKPLLFTTIKDQYSNDPVIKAAIRKATEARFEFK